MKIIKRIIFIFVFMISIFLFASCVQNNDEILDEAFSKLDIPAVTKTNLDFPEEIRVDSKIIDCKYYTTDPAINEKGVITRGESDITVSVSVELTYRSVSKNYVIGEITVLKLDKFSIKYDLDGGKCDELITVFLEDSDIILPTPTKYGYTFLGWYENSKLVEHVQNKNYNLIAVWVKNLYTINYNFDGGMTDSEYTIYFTDGDVITLPEPIKQGYLFAGWYENDTLVSDPTEYRDYNLKAIWVQKTYNITFDLNGGVSDELFTSFNASEDVVLPIPTKVGYNFIGWFDGNNLVTKLENRDYYLVARWQLPNTLIINKDIDYCEVGGDAYFSIEGIKEDEYVNYDFIVSDEELMTIGDDYIGKFLKAGVVTLTVVHKEYDTTRGSITFEIKNKKPSLYCSVDTVFIDSRFNIYIPNYDNNLELFDIKISNDKVINYDKYGFYGLSKGNAIITFSLKEDPSINTSIAITVYPIAPVIEIYSSDMVVNDRYKIIITNYLDSEEYTIESSDEEIVSIEGNLIEAKKQGNATIKVTLCSNPNYYSTIDIKVYPITPILIPTVSNLLVGGKARLIISNLDELESSDLSDYDVTITSSLVASIDEEFMITALTEGVAVVRVTHKDNPLITASTEITVGHTSSKRDSNGEVGSGALFLSLDDPKCYIHAGDMGIINIDGATDLMNYTYVSSDVTMLAVYDDGTFTTIKEGIATIFVRNKLDSNVMGTINIQIYGIPNVNYIERLINVATSQLGYREDGDNNTKYGEWYGLPGEAWCAMFVSWCANRAGISTEVIPKYCGCTAGMRWFVERDQFGYKESYTPKAGDLIFFLSDGASHTGIVINCDGKTVYTIEGNTSNMVAKRSYPINYHTITGYGIPNYPEYNGEVSGGDTSGATDGGGQSTQ